MKLTFWGTRGTVPVPGPDTVRYGGNTTCVSVETGNGELLIFDSGTGIRNLGKMLVAKPEMHCATLFMTHSHWDHIQGFPLFASAYDPSFSLTVLGWSSHRMSLHEILARQQSSPVFPVPLDALHANIQIGEYCMDGVERGGVRIRVEPLIHPGGACGFRIDEDGRAVVFMTDNELPEPGPDFDRFVNYCAGADLLIHDAQYTDEELDLHRGWGHSAISQAVALANASGVKRLGLFHHDPDRSDAALDAIVTKRRAIEEASGSGLFIFAAAEGDTHEI